MNIFLTLLPTLVALFPFHEQLMNVLEEPLFWMYTAPPPLPHCSKIEENKENKERNTEVVHTELMLKIIP